MIKKNIKYLFITFIIFFAATQVLLAQEATPSAIPEDKVTEKIKEQLEKVVDKKIDAVKEEILKDSEKKYAYFGKVKEVNENQITIINNDQEKQVEVASDAAILKSIPKKGKSNIKLNEIIKDDYLIAMGIKKGDLLIARRVLITQIPEASEKRKLFWGKVTEIDSKKVQFKTNGDTYTITISEKTNLKIIGQTTATTDKIQLNNFIYLVATLDSKEQIDVVKSVLVVPNTTTLNEPSIAPQTASPSAMAE